MVNPHILAVIAAATLVLHTPSAALDSLDIDPLGQQRFATPLYLGASAVVPGLGQILNRSYVKGGLFLASQVITSAVAIERHSRDQGWSTSLGAQQVRVDAARSAFGTYQDSIGYYELRLGDTTVAESLRTQEFNRFTAALGLAQKGFDTEVERSELLHYDRRLDRSAFYNAACWAAGLYAFNILDMIGHSGWLTPRGPRKPATAGWLSAIPALGLGQLYNGKTTKAGLILMTQTGLGIMALNYHVLMDDADDHWQKLRSGANAPNSLYNEFGDDWNARRDNAFRRRNTYLWYSLLFYLYGVVDAVVDAHLSDIDEKMRLEPDLGGGKAGLIMHIDIPGLGFASAKPESR